MLKKCLILAVSLLAIQSMTYAADKSDHETDMLPSSPKQTEIVNDAVVDTIAPITTEIENTPTSQPQDGVAPVIEASTTTKKSSSNKKKSSCFSCFGSSKTKD